MCCRAWRSFADLVGTDLLVDHTVIDPGYHRLPTGTITGAPPNYRCCAGFRTPAMRRSATRSETGVGKAPRHEIAGEWAPSVPRALWGFSRGVRLGKVGSNCRWPSHCLAGWVWTTGGASVAEADWQCNSGPI